MSNMLKKLLTALLMACLLTALAAPALADTLRFGTVKASTSVNLRASASTSSRKLGSYKGNTWLRVISQSGSWYKVSGPDGKTGWMRSDYVFISAAAKGTIGVVDASGGLVLRKSASSSSTSLGKYPDGTPCILLSETGSWYHVTVDGKAGYFDADHIDKKYMTYASALATVSTKNGGSVNLRQGPGTSYSSLKSVKNGTIVMVLQEGSEWWKVSVNGTVGFIGTDYLRDGVKTISSSTSDPAPDTGDDEDMSAAGYEAKVKLSGSSKLNLREYPTTASASLGLYRNGTQVYVLERGANWCRVRVEGQIGYMATRYLQKLSSAAPDVDDDDDKPETSKGYAEVRLSGTSKLNLRAEASTRSESLATYPSGTMVEVLSRGTSWCKVRIDGMTGYMSTRYLSFNGLAGKPTMIVTHPDATYVNLREAPDLDDGDVIFKVPHGSEVEVLVHGKTWCQVKYKTYTGYMMTRYLEDE